MGSELAKWDDPHSDPIQDIKDAVERMLRAHPEQYSCAAKGHLVHPVTRFCIVCFERH